MISVIVPARNEYLLKKTVENIRRNFVTDYEIIIYLDGQTEYELPRSEAGLKIISCETSQGLRSAINQSISASKGDYILKVDAHCIFGQEFDRLLLRDIKDDQVVVARRFTLDLPTWQPVPRIVDYYYLSCPWTHPHSMMMQSCPWISQTEKMHDLPIDDLMCFQGSMWMMSRKHWDWLGGLSEEFTFAEHHEISMKTWLGGRQVKINKNTWYAHPRESVRGYHMSMSTVYSDHERSAKFWTRDEWQGRIHDFDWLIDRFWPLPTEHNRHRLEKYYWPEKWWETYL